VVDTIGLKLLDYIGADRVMWSIDYPHNESTYGFSWQAIQEVLDHVSESDARKILGDTARALYKLD
jgi:predicted TIM-barrel fold metal-dependent hydrolase